MDNKNYYRILGVRDDATRAQIDKAYKARLARLNSADYADDAEYVKKKKAQAKHAYEVLTGVSAPCSDEVKENRFERRKDRIEAKEGLDDDDFLDDGTSERHLKKARQRGSRDTDFGFKSFDLSKLTGFFGNLKSMGGTSTGGFGNKQKSNAGKAKYGNNALKPVFVMIAVFVATTIITMGLNMFMADEIGIDFSLEADLNERIESAEYMLLGTDYYSYLDKSVMAASEDIVWDMGVNETGDTEIYYGISNALSWLDIYEYEEFFEQITGITDFYESHDDYDCAKAFVDWLGAPSFEEIAGITSEVTGEPILTMGDYMYHLSEVIWQEY